MKRPNNPEQLIDSYLYAIERKLPSSQKEDILKELKSNIWDQVEALESEMAEPPVKASLESVSAVLEAMGAPDQVAEQYAGRPRYLIGPELIETYWMVLLIVGIVGLVGGTFGQFLRGDWVMTSGYMGYEMIIHMFGNVLEVAISSVGSVTIIFLLIERLLHRQLELSTGKDKSKAWSASQLEIKPADGNLIKLSDSIWDIVWVCIAFGLLNFGLDKVAVYYTVGSDDVLRSVPFLSKDLIRSYLPWLNMTLIASFALGLYQIMRKQWNLPTRLIDSALSLISMVLIVGLFTSPYLIIPGAFESIEALAPNTSLGVEAGVNVGLRTFIAVFVVIEFFNIGKHAFYLFNRK